MEVELVLMAGLPGSGKTSYLSRMENEGWLIFDDFKIGTYALRFRTSPRLQNLIAELRRGHRCVIADIHFCDERARNEAEQDLRSEISGLEPRWLFFENNPQACELNIRARGRNCIEEELGYLGKYSPSYQIPEGLVPIPVWRSDGTDHRQLGTGYCA